MISLNYSNQNLQNRSFKGQQLAGADFSGSDLRGGNFTGANLIGANFQQVKMGQSQRQVNVLVITAIVSPIILCGSCILLVEVLTTLLSEPVLNFLFGALPFLFFLAEIFLRDSLIVQFPKLSNIFGMGAIATLFLAMLLLTFWFVMIAFPSFSSSPAQGCFFLLLMSVSGIVSFRILQWLRQLIQSHSGTSFRKANLTDTDFSYSLVRNTDFSFAILTGVCVFDWKLPIHNKFISIDCKYLYLKAEKQERQPREGNFRLSELARILDKLGND
ncbi:hypothetical protein NIES21_59890 (plasmid) [Anabaenopsis circularis NIES-21]|uniref:Pentapeptide repeat-containing protein n=1 Tax=Anabaenopsis circularis NIES-21 TaxID=1085406 RepID=A0A1Z4GRJ5_9CYAN|nr:hypothetical protein NIES21_59890 [Anabaenopsis circularis NIES-21]